jgi:MFS transporter, DHA2 family, multidrug resistance protein
VLGLDATVLNVALPELSTSLHATTGQLQRFADAYTLMVAVATLPAATWGIASAASGCWSPP